LVIVLPWSIEFLEIQDKMRLHQHARNVVPRSSA
jgi:hypothetical protein